MHNHSCILCGLDRQRRAGEMQDGNPRMIENIRHHGYHKVGVFSEQANEPNFGYTVGLSHRYSHPELIVFGLDIDTEFDILDAAIDALKEGARFADNTESNEILEGLSVKFLHLTPSLYREYVQQACNFYGGNSFAVLVLTWPDSNGTYPSSALAPSWLRKRQPSVWN